MVMAGGHSGEKYLIFHRWGRFALTAGALCVVAMCTIVGQAATAQAAPRRVAVVNMAEHQATGAKAAAALRAELASQDDLSPTRAGDLSRALEGPLGALSADARQIARVRGLFVAARKAKAKFAYAAALRRLAEAEVVLLGITPSNKVNALLAETNFRAGLIHAADNKRGRALRAFRTVRSLDSKRAALDPGRYPPPIVALYAKAATTPIGNARTKVTTTYDGATVFLNGRKIGKAPITIALSPGIHYVVATLKGYRASGAKLELSDGSAPPTRLRLQTLSIDDQARLLRRRLYKRGQFLTLGREVARLAQVDAVVIIGGPKKVLSAAIYDTRSDLVSTWRRFDTTPVDMILTPLLPLPELVFPNLKYIVPGPIKQQEKWHEKLWVRVSGGIAAVAITVLAVSLSDSGTPMTKPGGIGF